MCSGLTMIMGIKILTIACPSAALIAVVSFKMNKKTFSDFLIHELLVADPLSNQCKTSYLCYSWVQRQKAGPGPGPWLGPLCWDPSFEPRYLMEYHGLCQILGCAVEQDILDGLM